MAASHRCGGPTMADRGASGRARVGDAPLPCTAASCPAPAGVVPPSTLPASRRHAAAAVGAPLPSCRRSQPRRARPHTVRAAPLGPPVALPPPHLPPRSYHVLIAGDARHRGAEPRRHGGGARWLSRAWQTSTGRGGRAVGAAGGGQLRAAEEAAAEEVAMAPRWREMRRGGEPAVGDGSDGAAIRRAVEALRQRRRGLATAA